METPPALRAIYARCPYIDRQISYGSSPAHADITITVSTPRLTYTVRNDLEARADDVPYIYADQQLVAQWHEKLAHLPGKKIGICWCSSPLYNNTTKEKSVSPRSIPLTLFEPMLAYEAATFISLQCGFGVEQLKEVSGRRPLVFEDIDTTHGRFMDTMAIMKNLDLVVTVDTSIAHIAGALGIPVWIILPKCSDFRWFTDRTNSVWYPSMRIFRQKPYEEWEPVLKEVLTALQEFCNV
jgi:ADP-heptose:LPS heptosyltransferase